MKKGFTLIELLVVIAILAVLATAVVVVLNPAELLRQGRDSTRFSDLSAVQSAIALYLSDVTTPDLDHNDVSCQRDVPPLGSPDPEARCTANAGAVGPTGETCSVPVNSRESDGDGWVPVNLTAITTGSPLSSLPVDPSNGTTNYYAYFCDGGLLTYEINANMESTKYAVNEGTDGGSDASWYEVGNDPGLDL